MEKPNNYDNFDEIYKKSIKTSVENGSYFRDAFSWFSVAYLRTIVDRSFFIFMSIMGVMIIYFVIIIINMILPLKEDIYITIKENDLTKYKTNIYDISENKDAETTDEHILRYLITNYVKNRESHNYKQANINDINNKLNVIQNTSSSDVFSEFKYFMSSENSNGPYYYFGKNIETSVTVDSFDFVRIQRKKILDKVIDYFNIKLLPIKADVYYTLTIQVGDNISYEKRRASVSFKFTGPELNKETNKYSPIKFLITEYKNYNVR